MEASRRTRLQVHVSPKRGLFKDDFYVKEANWQDSFLSEKLKDERSRVGERGGGELVKVCQVQRALRCAVFLSLVKL